MSMHRKNKDSGSSNRSYNARWFVLSVRRRRKRELQAKISRRVGRFTRRLMKKARKSYIKRQGFLAQVTHKGPSKLAQRCSHESRRAVDGTMRI